MDLEKTITRLLAITLTAPLILLSAGTLANAEGESIRVISTSVTSEFPGGIRFKVQASGENEITSVAVRFKTGRQTRGTYDYLNLQQGLTIESELFFRTNTGARYIPPGTIITYNFEIEDSEGQRLDTEPVEFIYQDPRFEWNEVSQGPVTVAYHGPVKTRADLILDAIIQTIDFMGPLLGADTEEPIRVNMYNNVKEMLEALPPGSTTIRRELITEGQAFTNVGTLLVLGGGRAATGTASHEVTHILTHRAGDSVFSNVPQWLDEGLAEYGNIAPGFSYDIALEFALETDRLLPITSMATLPGIPEDVIIFYGESRSLIRFMVRQFGPQKMKKLMTSVKGGANMEDALQEAYGVGRLRLENLWRESIGAPEYVPPETGTARPTPIARPTFLPYSLTPQPESATISAVESTPTPEPEATITPTPALTATVAPASEQPPAAQPESGGGGGCNAPVHGGPKALDMSVFAFLVGLAGLCLRRTMKR